MENRESVSIGIVLVVKMRSLPETFAGGDELAVVTSRLGLDGESWPREVRDDETRLLDENSFPMKLLIPSFFDGS